MASMKEEIHSQTQVMQSKLSQQISLQHASSPTWKKNHPISIVMPNGRHQKADHFVSYLAPGIKQVSEDGRGHPGQQAHGKHLEQLVMQNLKKNPRTQVKHLKRTRLISQRQHENKVRNDQAKQARQEHDERFKVTQRRLIEEERFKANPEQATVEKFLDRQWVDCRNSDPVEDKKLLEQGKAMHLQNDKLFENLLERISGGHVSNDATQLMQDSTEYQTGTTSLVMPVEQQKQPNNYNESSHDQQEDFVGSGSRQHSQQRIKQDDRDDLTKSSHSPPRDRNKNRQQISRQKKSRRDMLQNISKSQLKMFKDVAVLPNTTRNSRQHEPAKQEGNQKASVATPTSYNQNRRSGSDMLLKVQQDRQVLVPPPSSFNKLVDLQRSVKVKDGKSLDFLIADLPVTQFAAQQRVNQDSHVEIKIENQVPSTQVVQSPASKGPPEKTSTSTAALYLSTADGQHTGKPLLRQQDPQQTGSFPSPQLQSRQQHQFFTSRGTTTNNNNKSTRTKFAQFNRMILQEVKPAQLEPLPLKIPDIARPLASGRAHQQISRNAPSFEMLGTTSPERGGSTGVPTTRHYQTSQNRNERMMVVQTTNANDAAHIEMLLAATRKRRRADTKKLQISSTEIRKEEFEEEDEDLLSEANQVRSCETDGRVASSPESRDVKRDAMNQSFGAKIIVEDYNSPNKQESLPEGEDQQALHTYLGYLNGQETEKLSKDKQQSSNKIAPLRNNQSLNKKVQELLERCSQTNIVLKDNAMSAVNPPRNLFNSSLQRKITTPLSTENLHNALFNKKGFKQPLLSKKAKQFFAPVANLRSARNITSQPSSDAAREYLSPDKINSTTHRLKQLTSEQLEARRAQLHQAQAKQAKNANQKEPATMNSALNGAGLAVSSSNEPRKSGHQMSNQQLIRQGQTAARNNKIRSNNLRELLQINEFGQPQQQASAALGTDSRMLSLQDRKLATNNITGSLILNRANENGGGYAPGSLNPATLRHLQMSGAKSHIRMNSDGREEIHATDFGDLLKISSPRGGHQQIINQPANKSALSQRSGLSFAIGSTSNRDANFSPEILERLPAILHKTNVYNSSDLVNTSGVYSAMEQSQFNQSKAGQRIQSGEQSLYDDSVNIKVKTAQIEDEECDAPNPLQKPQDQDTKSILRASNGIKVYKKNSASRRDRSLTHKLKPGNSEVAGKGSNAVKRNSMLGQKQQQQQRSPEQLSKKESEGGGLRASAANATDQGMVDATGRQAARHWQAHVKVDTKQKMRSQGSLVSEYLGQTKDLGAELKDLNMDISQIV